MSVRVAIDGCDGSRRKLLPGLHHSGSSDEIGGVAVDELDVAEDNAHPPSYEAEAALSSLPGELRAEAGAVAINGDSIELPGRLPKRCCRYDNDGGFGNRVLDTTPA
jgi:hypothetical protein